MSDSKTSDCTTSESTTSESQVGTSEHVISVIVPVTSSDVSIATLLEGYSRPLREAGYEFELVFVFDGVHGALVEEVEALCVDHPVQLVRLHGDGLGEAIALSAGVDRARGDYIINAPQYLQSEPDDLVKVVQAMESGADFVATWRHPRVDPLLNRLQSRLFNWSLRIVMGIPYHDLNSGLRGMRRQVIEEVNVYGEMYRYLPVLAKRQGFRVVEVKVRHREEQGRRGVYGVGVYVRRFLDILAITFLTRFTKKPLRFFGMLAMFAMLLGISLGIHPLYEKLFDGHTLRDRPIFILACITVAFGVQLIGFGLVGEIIIFTQSANQRDYKIQEILGGGAGAGGSGAGGSGAGGKDKKTESGEGLGMSSPQSPNLGPLSGAVGGPSGSMRVRELLPGEDARWDSFVQQHPQGSFFHLSGWRRVVEETFGHEPHYLVAEKNREWVGVLPIVHVKSPFIGKQMISVPYAVYGGVIADDPEIFEQLVENAARHGEALGCDYVELRHLEIRPGEREGNDLYVTFRKELPESADAVMPAIPKKARAEVRRARDKNQMTFAVEDDLKLFYGLFCEDKRRLGSPSLPFRWFRNLKDEFGQRIVMHVVRDAKGEPVTAVLSFLFGDRLYAYYSGTSSAGRGTGVNDFVYCRIMEWCVDKGIKHFDFGRSRADSGAARFKKNMGFVPEPLNYEYVMLTPAAKLPDFHPSNPKLNRPRQIWAKLPAAVTTRLGGRLSKYLP